MKRAQWMTGVVLMLLVFAPVALALTYHTIVMDGVNDFAGDERVSWSTHGGGGTGADLDGLYVTWDLNNLYLGLDTFNTASWDAAYGFALDVDQVANSGYSGASAPSDAWNRLIGFSNPYLPDYQIYFYWDGASGAVTSANRCAWDGVSSWNYTTLATPADYDYAGNATSGLTYLETQVSWTDLGGVPQRLKVYAWVAGGDGSSAVDTIPYDGNVPAGDSWVDNDVLGKSREVWVDFGMDGTPDESISPAEGQDNTAVTLSGLGASSGGVWVALLAAAGLAAVLAGGTLVAQRRR